MDFQLFAMSGLFRNQNVAYLEIERIGCPLHYAIPGTPEVACRKRLADLASQTRIVRGWLLSLGGLGSHRGHTRL
jgi:hypothetical protein